MFISIGKVAKLAGVSKSTLRRWEKEDYPLPDYRTRGKHRRYRYKKISEGMAELFMSNVLRIIVKSTLNRIDYKIKIVDTIRRN